MRRYDMTKQLQIQRQKNYKYKDKDIFRTPKGRSLTFDQSDEEAKPDQRPKTKTKTMTNTCEIEV